MSLIRAIVNDRDTRREARAALLAVVPHEDNNDFRKASTMVLVIVWGGLTVAISTGHAMPTEGYGLLTVFVWSRYGKLQEKQARDLGDADNKQG